MRFNLSIFLALWVRTADTIMAQTLPLRLVTFNIRYAATSRQTNEKPWSIRAPLVVSQLQGAAANASSGAETIIGLQEVLKGQLDDLSAGLGSAWAHIGVGRDDGKEAGEHNPILYRPSALRLLFNETKWLSPTPDTPSFGWNAGSRRLINIAVFEHIKTGKQFIAANTHLDNASSEARSKGVQVALDVIKDVQAKWGPLAVSLTGDFNSQPNADAYNTVFSSGYLNELYNITQASERFGEYDTYTGFDPTKEKEVSQRIDFIWLGPVAEKRWEADRYEVLSNVKDGVYLSDHRAVVGDVKMVV
jgi:endonuclease/exonuclease/phosphatase family metal-dependent hydrolase